MAIFNYKALSTDKKIKEGLVEAPNKDIAVELLLEKGLTTISISQEQGTINTGYDIFGKIKAKDLVTFSRQFSVMISANVPVVQSLRILVEQTSNIKLKIAVSEIADEVDAGSRLSDALGKKPNIFSNFFVNVIRSGETSGRLDEVLNYLADEMEKDYELTSKIRGAMIYPIVVICGILAVGIAMMVFVIPKLTAILSESGAELPLSTRVMIATSNIFTNYWWLLLILLTAMVAGLRFYAKKLKGAEQIDYIKLKLPVFGKLFQLIYLVRFTRSMNTLILGGITVANSLRVVSGVVDNKIYQKLISETIKEVEDGNSISDTFIKSKIIPKMVAQMINVGEKTGKLDVILAHITDFYNREISNIVSNLTTLMEPLIMIVMGVGVGIMVAAIILPMYNLATSV